MIRIIFKRIYISNILSLLKIELEDNWESFLLYVILFNI